jgi:hypothetical protein
MSSKHAIKEQPTLIRFNQVVLFCGIMLLFFGCNKINNNKVPGTVDNLLAARPQPPRTNPFSVSNLRKAEKTLNPTMSDADIANKVNAMPSLVYFSFDPSNLSKDQVTQLEKDSTVQLMDFPFGNANLYSDNSPADSATIAQSKDGKIYGVASLKSIIAQNLLQTTCLQPKILDTLVQLTDADSVLQVLVMIKAGFGDEILEPGTPGTTTSTISLDSFIYISTHGLASRSSVNSTAARPESFFGSIIGAIGSLLSHLKIRICIFQQPHGTVSYYDDQLGRMEPVRGMQVWGLVFGIPIHSYTDANGNYQLPWRFLIGTFMGTHAKNDRVNIKPLDTHSIIPQIELNTLIVQFIVGSIEIKGWETPCDMKDGVNFNFTGHTQVRYWSQLLNAVYFHDKYCNQENIPTAPQGLVIYAQWAKTGGIVDLEGNPDFGSAGTYLIHHILTDNAIAPTLGVILDVNANPILALAYHILEGELPDMSFRVPAAAQPKFYCCRLAETAFHELSHASQEQILGNNWWISLLNSNELHSSGFRDPDGQANPYGKGDETNAGKIAVTESWAEFLGNEFTIRRYGNAAYNRVTNSYNPDFSRIPNLFNSSNLPIEYAQCSNIVENQYYFFGGWWIPIGIYHDLMDNTNLPPNNPKETWDVVQGVSIRQMYYAFGPNINSMCDYRTSFLQQNPGLSVRDVSAIFSNHSSNCGYVPSSCGANEVIRLNNNESITIDGSSTEPVWSRIIANPIHSVVVGNVPSAFTGASWKAAWDNNYLYVLVQVGDPIIRAADNPGANFWNYDAVELFIDGKGNQATKITYDAYDHQFGISYPQTPGTQSVYAPQGGGTYVNYKVRYTGAGYNMEIRIPWTALNAVFAAMPYAGAKIGFDVAVDDNDNNTGNRDAQLLWHSTSTQTFNNPSNFGMVTLDICSQ